MSITGDFPGKELYMEELRTIAESAQQWLDGTADREALIAAIRQADAECGSCGCELDPLYKCALELV